MTKNKVKCLKCGSYNTSKLGTRPVPGKKIRKQAYVCWDCGYQWVEGSKCRKKI